MIKVSICVPVYGVEKYIERCARSMFEQTYDNIEFLFVNDCTKDNSIKILRNVIEDYPKIKDRVRIVNHKVNRGLAAARNTAVENATGDFIYWLDSDDYIDVTTIEKVVKNQKANESDIVINDFLKLCPGYKLYVNQQSTTSPIEFIHKILRDECEHWLAGKLIRLALYKDNGIKALEGANMGEDFQVCPQLMLYSKKISYVTEPLYIYDMQNVTSYGHSVKESVQWQRWDSYNEVVKHLPTKEFQEDLAYQKLQMVYFQLKTFILSPDTLSIKYFNYLQDRLNEVPDDIINNYVLYKRILVKWSKKIGKIQTYSELPLKLLKSYVIFINAVNGLKNKYLSKKS